MQTQALARTTRVLMPLASIFALPPAEPRILIVNEDLRSAALLKKTLNGLGYHTMLIAYSAQRALAIADSTMLSVVLVDLELPDMTGFQLASRLHAHRHSHVRYVPLIAIAEHPREGDRERARAGGFMGCLAKPVPATELNRLMRMARD